LQIARISSFPPPFQTVIAQMRDLPELRTSLFRMRDFAQAHGIATIEDVPPEKWTFHMSIASCSSLSADRWALIARLAERTVPADVSVVIEEAELVCFDGGPERLLGVSRLIG
jgi:hypothetical protein